MSYLPVSPHTTNIKHRTLLYIVGCISRGKLDNFAYLETHGASGICIDKYTRQKVKGSPLIVHEKLPSIPMSLCEIHEGRFQTLSHQFKDMNHVRVLRGDCNELIDQLHELPDVAWYFHFVDPSGVSVKNRSGTCQLLFETMTKIAEFERSEFLLNFPLNPFYRAGTYYLNDPNERSSWSVNLTRFFGNEDWMQYYDGEWDEESLVNDYIRRLQEYFDQPMIKHLVTTKRGQPVYYLVFATNHGLGIKFAKRAFHLADTDWKYRYDGQTLLKKWR